MRGDEIGRIDAALADRVARMSGGSQRWLKTALQSIAANDEMFGAGEDQERDRAVERGRERPAEAVREAELEVERLPDLEDVLTGKVSLSEQLEAYPELAEELEGLSDIIDILRQAGERRRERGEQILREEILGEEPGEDEEEDRERE